MTQIRKLILLWTLILSLILLSLAKPDLINKNSFIHSLVSVELISILVVMLTITLAAVANIHLTINRISAGAGKNLKEMADEVRKEINSNAWSLFWSFVLALFALVVKGWVKEVPLALALANSAGISVLLFSILILHDIYQSIFELSSFTQPEKAREDDGSPDL